MSDHNRYSWGWRPTPGAEPDHQQQSDEKVERADLQKRWKEGIKPVKPTLVKVTDTRCLFYKGKLNEIHGSPGSGKTNIAVWAVMMILKQLKNAIIVYIDPEDNMHGFFG